MDFHGTFAYLEMNEIIHTIQDIILNVTPVTVINSIPKLKEACFTLLSALRGVRTPPGAVQLVTGIKKP